MIASANEKNYQRLWLGTLIVFELLRTFQVGVFTVYPFPIV